MIGENVRKGSQKIEDKKIKHKTLNGVLPLKGWYYPLRPGLGLSQIQVTSLCL
jgi:hypothetical protein